MTTKAVMPALIRVRDVMTAEVHGLAHDMSLAEAAQVLRERQIGGAERLASPRRREQDGSGGRRGLGAEPRGSGEAVRPPEAAQAF